MRGGTAKERAVAELMNAHGGHISREACSNLMRATYDAGREQGIEDAAGIADNHRTKEGRMAWISLDIAAEIRKLKDGKE
jgi:hypothetical protein